MVFAISLLLAFTHEGALLLLLTVLATLVPRGLRSTPFRRAIANLIVILMLAVTSKTLFPPDDYYADAFVRAALHFFDLAIFRVEVVVELLAAVIAYAAIFGLISIWLPKRACIYALGILLLLLCIYWGRFDHSVHANSRYYLRTALVVATPLLGVMAALVAMTREGIVLDPLAKLQRTLISPRNRMCALASILVAVTLIHAVETGKFVTAWSGYRDAIAALAMSEESDLGTRLSAFRLVKAGSAGSRPLGMVLDYSLSVGHPLELPAEQANYRSDRKLLLVILRHGDK